MSERPAAAPYDPWKSFRGVMAGTLILEAIVVLLALPVVGAVGGGLTAFSTAYLAGFALLRTGFRQSLLETFLLALGKARVITLLFPLFHAASLPLSKSFLLGLLTNA